MIYLIICVISFLVAILTLFSGFGVTTLLLPTFSLFFSIEVAIAAIAVVHLINNIIKFFLVGRMANLAVTLKFAIPAAITAALGAWLLTKMSAIPLVSYQIGTHEFHIELLKLSIGLLLGVFALFELIPRFSKIGLKPKFIPLGGAISGFFGGLSGLQGALRSMFLLKAGLSKNEFVGTTVASSIIVDISRITVYGTSVLGGHLEELKSQTLSKLVIAATIAACMGSILGTRILKKVTFKTVQVIVGVLLLIVAFGLSVGIL